MFELLVLYSVQRSEKNCSLSDTFLNKRMRKVSHLQQHTLQAVFTANHLISHLKKSGYKYSQKQYRFLHIIF